MYVATFWLCNVLCVTLQCLLIHFEELVQYNTLLFIVGLSASLNNVRFHFCKVSPPFDTRGKFSSVNFKVDKLVIDGKNQIFSMLSALDVNRLSTINMESIKSFLQDIDEDNILADMDATAENVFFFPLANNILQHNYIK